MSQDFEELLASFNAANVRYLIGGAHALALHARPRATKDLDLFVEPTKVNAKRIRRALADFFGGSVPHYVSEAALMDANSIVQLGVAPLRVDIISTFGTLSFRQAWAEKVSARFGSVPAHYLSREHLIAEKQFYDRPQDRADVAVLLARPAPAARPRPHGRKKKKPSRRADS